MLVATVDVYSIAHRIMEISLSETASASSSHSYDRLCSTNTLCIAKLHLTNQNDEFVDTNVALAAVNQQIARRLGYGTATDCNPEHRGQNVIQHQHQL